MGKIIMLTAALIAARVAGSYGALKIIDFVENKCKK